MENVAIISGRYPLTEFNSSVNHKLYADTYNYTYIHCNWPTKASNLYLNKIHYILNYLDFFDFVIWIDDDAFFYDFNLDIMKFAPQANAFISLCKSPDFKTLETYFSSGQFIVKSNQLSKQFFKDILLQDLKKIKNWWTDKLGYFSNGDQDIMIYLLLTNEKYINKCQLFNYRCFNSRFENLYEQDIHNPLILHFTGKPEIKQRNYLTVQKKTGLHSSLVNDKLLKEYKIITLNKKSVFQKLKGNIKGKLK